MTEHQQAGDDPRPEFQLLQQTGLFPQTAPVAPLSARHVGGKRMGITSSLALPDPAASSLGCDVSLVQLCQCQTCVSGCCWLPEAIVEVPVPTAWQDRTGIAQLTLQRTGHSSHPPPGWSRLRVALLAPFLPPAATEVPHSPGLSAPPRRAAAPWDNRGCCISGGVPLASSAAQAAKPQKSGITPVQCGNQQDRADGAGDQPHLQHAYSCASQLPWGRVLSHRELKPSKKTAGSGPSEASQGKPLPGPTQQSSSPALKQQLKPDL